MDILSKSGWLCAEEWRNRYQSHSFFLRPFWADLSKRAIAELGFIHSGSQPGLSDFSHWESVIGVSSTTVEGRKLLLSSSEEVKRCFRARESHFNPFSPT